MSEGQSFTTLPVNAGGGIDVRAGQLAARRHALAAREHHLRVSRGLHFQQRERSARLAQKLHDHNGQLVVPHDGHPRFCGTCSESTSIFKPIPGPSHHRHEDSASWRASINNNSYRYPCHTCRTSYHTYNILELNINWTGGRIPVLATSSTLYNWQGARHRTGYEGDPLHVERVAVAGATVKGVAHAISANYFSLGEPVDLLLCAGINDIIKGRSAFEILADYVMLAEVLSTHLPTSTLSVCTLPLPPMLCRLAGDRTWRPDNFQNKLEVFIELNERIIQLNRQQARRTRRPTDLAPTFHTRGLRTRYNSGRRSVRPRNLLATVIGHRFSNWREDRPHRQLHLNEEVACSMGKATIKYFLAFYGHVPVIPRALRRDDDHGGGGGVTGRSGSGRLRIGCGLTDMAQ